MDLQALWLSIQLATVTALLLILLGTPLAYFLTFSRWPGRFFVEAIVALPLVLPPTVLGYYILALLGPSTPIGRSYLWLTGEPLPFSFEGLVVGSLIFSFPFAVQPLVVSFSSVGRELLEASWTLGASRTRTFFRIVVSRARTGFVTAAVLVFAHTLGEFGVVLMVGGNIPGATRTLSIALYDDVQVLNYERAATTALFLLIFSFAVLSVVFFLNRNAIRLWPLRD